AAPGAPAGGDPKAPRAEPCALEDVERRHVAEVLAWAGGNVTHAARVLGIDRMTLYNKMKRYGLKRPDDDEARRS
ncbi:MAG: helix-turn-helix domain-containing protein, partial [Anaeromyxobacteraceae bacterium]